jgi:hypothetical protein
MFWSAHCSSKICRQRTNKFLVNFLKKICLFQRDIGNELTFPMFLHTAVQHRSNFGLKFGEIFMIEKLLSDSVSRGGILFSNL